jgi:anti-sigma regulatory factor (Ser/Thr protein kinase)
LVQFYASDDQLTEQVTDFILDGNDAVAIVVATEAHRRSFARRLAAAGTSVGGAQRSGSLVLLDAQATLDQFFDGSRSDPEDYDAVIGGLVRTATSAGRPVRIYGEMVALLWEAGLVNAALELEDLWNELGRRLPFTLLCGYPSAAADAGADAVAQVCAAHSAVHGRPDQPATEETTRIFGRNASTPAAVRSWVRSALTGWQADAVLDDVTIVAAELTNNALLHTASDITLTLSLTPALIRVSVADSSSGVPAPGAPTERSNSGRGLHIVQALARTWGWNARPPGKVVWAELLR